MNATILKELRELVSANVISQETADNIEAFYKGKKVDNNRFTIILSILGSILVGLGIVLVVAHNWDEFNRLTKTIFAFLPLVLSQLLCVYVILKKKDSVAWKESCSTVLFFSVGACISLVAQIYHVSGTLSGFLLTWMWLTVPLVYLFSSFVVALLYIGGITWYTCLVGYDYPGEVPYLYFILLLILVPAYVRVWRRNPGGNAVLIFNWFLAFSFACCFGSFSLARDNYELLFIGYLALFCFYYLVGTRQEAGERRVISNSFFTLGLAGILVILNIWSFRWLWEGLSDNEAVAPFFAAPFPYFTGLLFLLIMYLFATRLKRRGWGEFDPVGFSVYIFTLAILLFRNYPKAGLFVINLWLLLLALYYIRKGSQRTHLGILNFGLLILTFLAIFRFFDDSIPFVWRGIIFLLTGVAIFAANIIIIKRKKAIAANQES